MDKFAETILLDNKKFNEAGYWEVPILRLENINVKHFYIDGAEIPPSQYNKDKNYIKFLSNTYTVNTSTRAELIVEINTSNKMVVFWLPVVLAILGILGNIAQPVLHSLNVIYKQDRILHVENTAYAYVPDKLTGEISVYPITEKLFRAEGYLLEDDIDKWDVYIAATISNNSKDPYSQEYEYYSGPKKLEIGTPIPFEVETDSGYTQTIQNMHEGVFRIIALVKKGSVIKTNKFKPSEIPDIKIISKSYYYPCEKMESR